MKRKYLALSIQCDFCGKIFSIEDVKKIEAKLADQFVMLYICPTCWSRERSEKKYILKRLKTCASELKLVLALFKRLTFGPWKASLKNVDPSKIREQKIQLLEQAIDIVWLNVKKASGTAEKGEEPPKMRYLRLLGYLMQVLDGVLKNYEMKEIEERLEKVESEVAKLEAEK